MSWPRGDKISAQLVASTSHKKFFKVRLVVKKLTVSKAHFCGNQPKSILNSNKPHHVNLLDPVVTYELILLSLYRGHANPKANFFYEFYVALCKESALSYEG